jgi:hypothetical protein
MRRRDCAPVLVKPGIPDSRRGCREARQPVPAGTQNSENLVAIGFLHWGSADPRLEPVFFYVADRLVPDLAIDVVGSRIRGVRVKAADRMAPVEHGLAGGGDRSSCISVAAPFRWRVHRSNPRHESKRAAGCHETRCLHQDSNRHVPVRVPPPAQ